MVSNGAVRFGTVPQWSALLHFRGDRFPSPEPRWLVARSNAKWPGRSYWTTAFRS